MRDPVITEAAGNVGGIIKLSLALGLSRTAVAGWKRVPAERVLQVERLTGVSRYKLRPDIYPDRRGDPREQQAAADHIRRQYS